MSYTPQRAYRIPDHTGEWLIFANKRKDLFHTAYTSLMAYMTPLRCVVIAALLCTGNAFARAKVPPSRTKTTHLTDTAYQKSLIYFFDRPARSMMEALPLGNGRMGMLSDGGVQRQTITLCESSMWSGSVDSTAWNPSASEQLPAIRQLLLSGRPKEAEELIYRTFVCGGVGSGRGQGANTPYGSYQVGGFLHLNWEKAPETSRYYRGLSLTEGCSQELLEVGGAAYRSKRLYSVFGGEVQVVHLTNHSTESRSDTLRLSLSRPENGRASAVSGFLTLSGALPDGKGGKGLGYAIVVRPSLSEGGELITQGNGLLIVNAPSIDLYIAHNTNYYDKRTPLVGRGIEQTLQAQSIGEGRLFAEHVQRFSAQMNRVQAHLAGSEAARTLLPIDQRLRAYHEHPELDPALAALYMQFGRYLLLSSTRPGALPPNLQGLWTETIQAPWNGDYHLNINLQMNYWPAEKGALPETVSPLTDWVESIVPSGERTAQTFYRAKGWVTHVLGNVWQFTAPGEHPSWGATNTSAAWLCEHLYNHYRYSQDHTYLQRIYPVMQGAARFFLTTLTEDPKTKDLVNVPTTSPENSYYTADGKEVAVAAGSTMDNQILRELFSTTREAALTLGQDRPFVDSLSTALRRLKPTTLGPDGRIMEWMEDFKEVDPHHRHVSHLYGLFPGSEITPQSTPDLAEGAKKTLIARGSSSTSWSMGWKVNFHARLGDAAGAYEVLNMLLRPVDALDPNTGKPYGSGSNPNLFSSHPPFQIDGNFGGASGIMEMLLSSETGYIIPLPALPKEWKSGSIQGLRVVGNATCSLSWSAGQLDRFVLEAHHPYRHTLLLPLEGQGYTLRLNGRPLDTKRLLREGRLHLPLMRAGDRLEVTKKG